MNPMKLTTLRTLVLGSTAAITTLGLMAAPASALASTSSTATDQARMTLIINRGNSEIGRRLTVLNKLSNKISSATKLSASDQADLKTEVSGEINGLTTLKNQLDGETTLAAAKTDAQNIFSGYRVYALVVPKVYLVKTADDQQTAETKLSTLATKIQSDITADQDTGKTITSLQNQLNDMTGKIQSAQSISGSIESKVVNLQPSDYNSDRTILSSDRDQLKTAQTDVTGAISDARGLITGLKSL